MLQSAKNLVKFVSKFNPSDEAVIKLGISHRKEVEAFLELNKGNTNDIYFEIVCLPTIETNVRASSDRNYIDCVGEVDGYKVELTFLLMHSEMKSFTSAEKHLLTDIVQGKDYERFMTPSEWNKFHKAFLSQKQSATIENFFVRNGHFGFREIVLAAFTWSETEDGGEYWNQISKRTSNVI
jgi:hypothetical protein